MIDQAYQKIAEQIHYVLLPGISKAFSDALHSNVFLQMNPDELQITCIKLALEALSLTILIWITRIIRSGSRKRRPPKPKAKQVPKVKMERKWTTTGWVWNEKECIWEPPDYIIKESNERWKYDKTKGIWIDLNKEE